MTGREEPSDEELERAERIRRLRTGGERSRGHEMRERRREAAGDGERPGGEEAGTANDDDDEADDGASADDTDDDDESTDALSAAGDANVLEMAAALPEDGSLFVVPVREGLRREFNKVAEQLHLRYGFAYESELDAEAHVRPLALYLGVRALEDSDPEVVRELLSSVDELGAPEQ